MEVDPPPGFAPAGRCVHASRVKQVASAGRGHLVTLTSTAITAWATLPPSPGTEESTEGAACAPRVLAQLQLSPRDFVSAVAPCAGGGLLLGACLDGALRVWSLERLAQRSACAWRAGMVLQLLYNPGCAAAHEAHSGAIRGCRARACVHATRACDACARFPTACAGGAACTHTRPHACPIRTHDVISAGPTGAVSCWSSDPEAAGAATAQRAAAASGARPLTLPGGRLVPWGAGAFERARLKHHFIWGGGGARAGRTSATGQDGSSCAGAGAGAGEAACSCGRSPCTGARPGSGVCLQLLPEHQLLLVLDQVRRAAEGPPTWVWRRHRVGLPCAATAAGAGVDVQTGLQRARRTHKHSRSRPGRPHPFPPPHPAAGQADVHGLDAPSGARLFSWRGLAPAPLADVALDLGAGLLYAASTSPRVMVRGLPSTLAAAGLDALGGQGHTLSGYKGRQQGSTPGSTGREHQQLARAAGRQARGTWEARPVACCRAC